MLKSVVEANQNSKVDIEKQNNEWKDAKTLCRAEGNCRIPCMSSSPWVATFLYKQSCDPFLVKLMRRSFSPKPHPWCNLNLQSPSRYFDFKTSTVNFDLMHKSCFLLQWQACVWGHKRCLHIVAPIRQVVNMCKVQRKMGVRSAIKVVTKPNWSAKGARSLHKK